MSRENAEQLVRQIVAAWNDRDVDGFLAHFDVDCEVVFPPDVPEPGPFRGRDALRGWVEGFLAAWESHTVELVELTDANPWTVATLRLKAQGQSGIAFEDTGDAHVFEFRDGMVLRWRNYSDRDEALEAVGLQE